LGGRHQPPGFHRTPDLGVRQILSDQPFRTARTCSPAAKAPTIHTFAKPWPRPSSPTSAG
jgi:hypothetical protein